MFGIKKPSIQRRLRYAMMTTAEIGLLVIILFYSVTDYYKSRDTITEYLKNTSQLVNSQTAKALETKNDTDIQEIINMLKSVQLINTATIYDINGNIFGNTTIKNSKLQPYLLNRPSVEFKDGKVIFFNSIKNNKNNKVGSILLESNATNLYKVGQFHHCFLF